MLGSLHTKKYLLAILSFVHGVKGDREMSRSCAIRERSIDGSNSSLEAQIVNVISCS